MNKFEQLIEYVINEEDGKAEDLFHEIVVEKSRDIYESLMDSEDEFGGDKADELINDISTDEEGMREDEMGMEPEMGSEEPAAEMGMGDELGAMDDIGGMGEEEADLEDRVVDLEDSLDELLAQFDIAMGDEMGGEEEMGMEPGMDDMGMEPSIGDEEEMGMEGRFNEAVSLTKVSKGISNSTEEGTINKKSVNADNSGKKGAVAKPHQEIGEEGNVANPTVKPGDGTTEPNESKVTEPKKKGEDAGVNKKSLSGS